MGLPTPEDAAAALAAAETSRAQLAGGLRLPSFFYSSIGVAVAIQIATAAVEVAFDTGWTRLLAIAGVALFALTAGIQLPGSGGSTGCGSGDSRAGSCSERG